MIKLFKSKKGTEPKGSLRGRFDAIIGHGSTIQGNIQFSGGARVDGQIEGDINMAQLTKQCVLAIGQHGSVTGNVSGERIIIAGKVNGNVIATEWLELLPSAQVIGGEIQYKTLTVFAGAVIQGKMVEMTENSAETPTDSTTLS